MTTDEINSEKKFSAFCSSEKFCKKNLVQKVKKSSKFVVDLKPGRCLEKKNFKRITKLRLYFASRSPEFFFVGRQGHKFGRFVKVARSFGRG